MNLVITGMRGSGKSTISKMLAKKLQRDFLDLDKILEQKNNLSIQEMIKIHGWEYFRNKEAEIAEEVSLLNDKVISTGGGIITRVSNINALKKNGLFIFLNTPIYILLRRISTDQKRPRLTDKGSLADELKEIMNQREHLYRSSADIIIDTANLKPTKITDKIIEELKIRKI